MKKSLNKAEYELLAEFRRALRQFFHFSEEAARRMGLEPQQHQALLAVLGHPGRDQVALGELAEHLQIRPHSAVGLVNRLEKQGLVSRKTNPVDKRRVHVGLTAHGREVLETLSAAHRDELRRLGPGIGDLLRRLAVPDSPG